MSHLIKIYAVCKFSYFLVVKEINFDDVAIDVNAKKCLRLHFYLSTDIHNKKKIVNFDIDQWGLGSRRNSFGQGLYLCRLIAGCLYRNPKHRHACYLFISYSLYKLLSQSAV